MRADPYGLARLFDEYPDVYSAYRAIAISRLLGDAPAGGFAKRREQTRMGRLEAMARRVSR